MFVMIQEFLAKLTHLWLEIKAISIQTKQSPPLKTPVSFEDPENIELSLVNSIFVSENLS